MPIDTRGRERCERFIPLLDVARRDRLDRPPTDSLTQAPPCKLTLRHRLPLARPGFAVVGEQVIEQHRAATRRGKVINK